jgi:hypothetical protein
MVPKDSSAPEATRPRASRRAFAPSVPTGRPPGAVTWTVMLWAGLVSMFILLLVRIASY